MSITQRRSLDSNAIKLIAILAMTVDHIAWAVFPRYPRAALPLLMHLIGRITCPIMCYFIAEGFHYTHDVRKYTARLFLLHFFRTFAISMPSNDFVDWHSFIPFYYGSLLNQTSVMWALAWGLVMLLVANSDKIVDRLAAAHYFDLRGQLPSDWSCVASLCAGVRHEPGRSEKQDSGWSSMWRSTPWSIALPSTWSMGCCKWALSLAAGAPLLQWAARARSARQPRDEVAVLSLLSAASAADRPALKLTRTRKPGEAHIPAGFVYLRRKWLRSVSSRPSACIRESSADIALRSTEKIGQLLPVERDRKLRTACALRLLGQIGQQPLPRGALGKIVHLPRQNPVLLRQQRKQVFRQAGMERAAVRAAREHRSTSISSTVQLSTATTSLRIAPERALHTPRQKYRPPPVMPAATGCPRSPPSGCAPCRARAAQARAPPRPCGRYTRRADICVLQPVSRTAWAGSRPRESRQTASNFPKFSDHPRFSRPLLEIQQIYCPHSTILNPERQE